LRVNRERENKKEKEEELGFYMKMKISSKNFSHLLHTRHILHFNNLFENNSTKYVKFDIFILIFHFLVCLIEKKFYEISSLFSSQSFICLYLCGNKALDNAFNAFESLLYSYENTIKLSFIFISVSKTWNKLVSYLVFALLF
jgi:hypothetical protein